MALKTIVAAMTDLFFLVHITGPAKQLGMQVVSAKDKPSALAKVEAGAEVLVIDLTCAAAEPLDLIREAKAASPGINIIGFLPHVQIELGQRAIEAGCDTVLPRSAFARKLPELLAAAA